MPPVCLCIMLSIYYLSDVQTYKTIHKTVQKSMIKHITIIKATSPACIDPFTASFQFTDRLLVYTIKLYTYRYMRVVRKVR